MLMLSDVVRLGGGTQRVTQRATQTFSPNLQGVCADNALPIPAVRRLLCSGVRQVSFNNVEGVVEHLCRKGSRSVPITIMLGADMFVLRFI
jgi:hypothetical protein